jgi:predicted nucleotide-binding protein (sugar kinase/HSP70/actin superfamily)
VTEAISRIGIPRALLYHKRAALWHEYFSALGIETVVSPPSNRGILEAGCSLSVDETCLSVKLAVGHMAWLAEKGLPILVPRHVSVARGEYECSKLWGLYDIARNALPDARIIHYSVDASQQTHRRTHESGELYRLALSLGASHPRAVAAVTRAVRAQQHARAERVRAQEAVRGGAAEQPRVLVAAHAYNLGDAMIGGPVTEELARQGCEVIDSECVDHALAERLSARLSPSVYWTNSRQLLGAIEHWRGHVDGIIFLVTFPCGPDSLVTELAIRRVHEVPAIALVIDEQSGETGLKTRLESFVDILKMRRGQALAGAGSGAVA